MLTQQEKHRMYMNDVYSFIREYETTHPTSPMFHRDTLKFFGERFSDMRILKRIATVKEEWTEEKHECYVLSTLQRNNPNGASRDHYYFDINTLDIIQ